MVRFSFRSWLNLASRKVRPRQRPKSSLLIERLEDRVVLSAYTVTSFLDSVDATPGNGVGVDAAGNATLRAAIIDANATAGADTITLGAGTFALSIGGRGENAARTGDLDVSGNLTIEGAGTDQTFLDASLLDRYFHVLAGSTLTLRNVTIRNGRETNGGAIENNGTLLLENVNLTGNMAVTRGGAIYNNTGTLTLQSVNVFGNTSSEVASGVGSSIGGGLASFGGTVTIVSSQFSSNTASGDGGGIDSRSTVLQVSNTAFSNNFATNGGAIRLFNGSALLMNDTFSGDHATATGGAIASNICALTIDGGSFTGNYLSAIPANGAARTGGSLNLVGVNAASPAVTIMNVTFQQTGSGDGGAIFNSNARLNVANSTFDRVTGRQGGAINNTANGTLAMVNTTIVGSTGTLGGAIYNTAVLQMTNSTITGNTSTGQGAATSAAVANNTGTITSLNNLIAGNVNFADVLGAFTSLGGNLIGRGTGSAGFTQATDQAGSSSSPINPLLGLLANNGGRVPTIAVSSHSPARDKGVPGSVTTDARGQSRTADPTDIGAYEYENQLPVAGPFSATAFEDNVLTGELVATDADGDSLTYVLTSLPASGQLTVDQDGHFEYIPVPNEFGTFSFSYRVTDGRGLSNEVSAQIVVSPVNDAPIVGDQTFTVDENSSAATVVGNVVAFDIDSNTLTAEIVSGNDSGAFLLDPHTGGLIVADTSQFNFEINPTFTLVVSITDDANPSASTLATVIVHIADVNEAPQLSSPVYLIDENAADGTVIGGIPHTDEDAVQSYNYEIISSNVPGALAIDPVTGEITVADGTLLDFEAAPGILLLVRVTDQGSPTIVSETVVTIELNNVNEAPTISDQSLSVTENSEFSLYIGSVSAFDPDNDLLTYEIVSGNDDGAFTLDPHTGDLVVALSGPLNFEINPTFILLVRVTDSGTPVAASEATITVHVVDINEGPEVDGPLFTIDENSATGAVVGSVFATDVDNNQSLTFALVDADGTFAIDPITGQITIAEGAALDFEANSTFSLHIRVTDSGTPALSGDSEVIIVLNDLNEAPQIADQSLAVAENSANGTTVGAVNASDKDAGQSLTYLIVDGNFNDAFAIDPETGEIVIANGSELNFEGTSSYVLTVLVSDNADPSLSATALVTISILDINEVPNVPSQGFTLAENSAYGTSVGFVTASDPDVGQSLVYAIVSGNTDGAFAIDAVTGEITVTNSTALDFESASVFDLIVRLEDNGVPVLASTSMISILILDRNEVPALEAHAFSIAENSANGMTVGTIAGTDPDLFQSLTYSITDGNADGVFAIDAGTGEITVANSAALNFEGTTSYGLTITVTDDGGPGLSATALVTISVLDVNESPQISSQSFSLDENSEASAVVGGVTGTDPDAGQSLVYTIVSGNTDGAFAIDPTTGELTVANSAALNYELDPTFELVILIEDTGDPSLSATATISIALQDVNEVPQIQASSFSLDENSANDTSVGTISATDPDAGQTLTYSIDAGSAGGVFAIDPVTGHITVANLSALNFEATPTFTLTVTVTDNGIPALSASSLVTISLLDLNDAPEISPQVFSLSVGPENGLEIGLVTANDPDAGQSLTYSITSGNPDGGFAIDPVTGQITVANALPLLLQLTSTFSLVVEVTDNGAPALSSTATVLISLLDANQPPHIEAQSFTVDENSANGTTVASVLASDPNISDVLVYSITAGNDDGAFAINASTGEITVSNSALLNFEAHSSFTLEVQVTDNGLVSKSATAHVTIHVNDVNEAPYLEDSTFSINEHSANGTTVGTVSGSDEDSDQVLSYVIVSGNPGGVFAIDATTGTIVVADSAELNFEAQSSYTVEVKVADSGVPGLTATALITIQVNDVNEAPHLDDSTFTITEHSANGTEVGTVTGSDPDGGQSLSYAIVSGNTDEAFSIDAAAGKIVVANSAALDLNSTGTFTLELQVTDSGTPSLSTSATVTIRLNSLNEPPQISAASFAVDENSPNGTVVGTVTASDPDAGQSLYYFIVSGNTDGAFAINEATGQITVAKSAALNFETHASFALEVKVKDNGDPRLWATATVTITLNDVNEAPQLGEKTFAINEKSANGTVVGYVTGTDPDAGQSLTFSIVDGNANGAFAIDAVTGQITVANSTALNYATIKKFLLQVQVTDSGTPQLSNTATVTINLNPLTPPTRTVTMDVGIFDPTDSIRLGKKVGVVIFGSSSFDTRSIDVGSLRFGKLGTENSLYRDWRGQIDYWSRDVNRDGKLDLIVVARANNTGLQVGDTIAKLAGKTKSGESFSATETITVRPEYRRDWWWDRDRKHKD